MKFSIYKDKAGEWRWRLKASNGRIVATGGEGFSSKGKCRTSMLNVWGTFGSDNFVITEDE